MRSIKHNIFQYLINIPGFRINRKIVVLESDDWGSIRMPSVQVYNKLLKSGIRVDNCHFNRYDSLENVDDLESLFNLLIKFKDVNGNHPVITANTIVANPDFEKIKDSKYEQYFFEPFTETIKNYPNHSFKLWEQGMSQNIFHPQFHGREHVNVSRWMKALQNKSKEMQLAFDNKMFGISSTISNENNPSFMAALDADCKEDLLNQEVMLEDGLNIFHNIFGYKSKSFIAPNNIWHSSIENILHINNIEYIQGDFFREEPDLKGNHRKKFHFFGEKNANKQIYLLRNCAFEPSSDNSINWVTSCLHDIKTAFNSKKPAIIACHRVNFIGSIDPNNRSKTLNEFSILLQEILKKWPDVEFMTSDELGDLIRKSHE